MSNKFIRINLNQTVSRFELAEIKKEKDRWIIFGVFCLFFILILGFNFFILHKYNELISSRLKDAQKLINDSDEIRKNYENYNSLLDLLKSAASTKKEGGAAHNVKRVDAIKDLVMHIENPPASLEDDPRWITKTEENYLGVSLTYSTGIKSGP